MSSGRRLQNTAGKKGAQPGGAAAVSQQRESFKGWTRRGNRLLSERKRKDIFLKAWLVREGFLSSHGHRGLQDVAQSHACPWQSQDASTALKPARSTHQAGERPRCKTSSRAHEDRLARARPARQGRGHGSLSLLRFTLALSHMSQDFIPHPLARIKKKALLILKRIARHRRDAACSRGQKRQKNFYN